ncbi:MAG: ArnT family glycosyltransferase [Verrucomicrobiota bacterium JB025]|nr:glycosyltransferase family 39 protein [Verrucomicrobiota bacterium JB025]
MPALRITTTERRLLWCFLAILFALRVALIFHAPLTDTTEARYAEIARKMVETGNWVTPQFDYGVPFWGKPVLSTWVSAAGIRVFGANEFGARIFILCTAIGILALVHQWVKRWRGADQALVGIAILSSTAMFYLAAAAVMTDLVMIAGTTLAMVAFWNAMRAAGRRLWGFLFFTGLAVGLLAKGPVALILTAMPVGAWVLVRNQWRDAWRRLPWITGSLLTFALAAPWYALAEMRTPGFLHYFLYGEHIQRFLVSGWTGDLYGRAHSEPTGMIWIYWLASSLPWSLVFVAALFRPRRAARAVFRSADDLPFYLLLWLLAPVVFFTPAHNIIPTYAMTGLAAGALLVPELRGVFAAVPVVPGRAGRRFFAGASAVSLTVFAGGLVLFGSFPERTPKRSEKLVVEDALGSDSGASLYYWKRRVYSAEFYSGGTVRTLETDEDLRRLLSNDSRDFLAIYPGHLNKLPDWFLRSFVPLSRHHRTVLLGEVRAAPELPQTVSK